MSDKEIKYKITADAAQAERAIKQLAKKLKQVGDLTDVLMGGAASSSSTSTSLNATRSTAHGAHQTTAAGVGSGGSTSDHLAGSTSTARRVWDRLPPSWQNAMASGVRGASQIMDASHEGGYGQSAYARNMQGRITGHGEHVMRSAYAPIRAGNAAAGAQFTGNMVSNTTRSIGQGMQSLAENSAIFGPMGVALGLGGVAAGIGFELAGQGLQLRHDDLRELATMERYEAQAGAARGNGQRVGRWVDGSAVKTGANTVEVESEFQESDKYIRAAKYGFAPTEAAQMNASYSKALGGARGGGLNPFALTLGNLSPEVVASVLAQTVGGGGLYSANAPSTEAAFAMRTARKSGLRGSGIERYLQEIVSIVDGLSAKGIKLDFDGTNDFLRSLHEQGIQGKEGTRLARGMVDARQQALQMARAPLQQIAPLMLLGNAARGSENLLDVIGNLDKRADPGEIATQINRTAGAELSRYAHAGQGANVSRGEHDKMSRLRVKSFARGGGNLYAGGSIADDSYSVAIAEGRRAELATTEAMGRKENLEFIKEVQTLGQGMRSLGEKADGLVGVASSVMTETVKLVDKIEMFVNELYTP